MIPKEFTAIGERLRERHKALNGNPYYDGWLEVKELATAMGWSESKARYWAEKMVTARYLIWRYSPRGFGYFNPKEYRAAWVTIKKAKK